MIGTSGTNPLGGLILPIYTLTKQKKPKKNSNLAKVRGGPPYSLKWPKNGPKWPKMVGTSGTNPLGGLILPIYTLTKQKNPKKNSNLVKVRGGPPYSLK